MYVSSTTPLGNPSLVSEIHFQFPKLWKSSNLPLQQSLSPKCSISSKNSIMYPTTNYLIDGKVHWRVHSFSIERSCLISQFISNDTSQVREMLPCPAETTWAPSVWLLTLGRKYRRWFPLKCCLTLLRVNSGVCFRKFLTNNWTQISPLEPACFGKGNPAR